MPFLGEGVTTVGACFSAGFVSGICFDGLYEGVTDADFVSDVFAGVCVGCVFATDADFVKLDVVDAGEAECTFGVGEKEVKDPNPKLAPKSPKPPRSPSNPRASAPPTSASSDSSAAILDEVEVVGEGDKVAVGRGVGSGGGVDLLGGHCFPDEVDVTVG